MSWFSRILTLADGLVAAFVGVSLILVGLGSLLLGTGQGVWLYGLPMTRPWVAVLGILMGGVLCVCGMRAWRTRDP